MKAIQLGEICHFEKGNTGLAKATPGIYPLVTTGSERRTCDSYQFDTKAVCIPLVSSTGHGHASLKNVHYQEGKFALGSILVALTAKDKNQLDIQYLHLYLSELKDQILVPLMSGAANVALSVSKIKSIKIPLPSIYRQKEIVQQFNLIKHEDEQLKLELFNQRTLILKLRECILQEAIEGKLTEFWRTRNMPAESSSQLIKRIEAEKVRLNPMKGKKFWPPVKTELMPFKPPLNWTWCHLGEVVTDTDSGWSPKCENYPAENGTWGVLKTTAVQCMKYAPQENKALPNTLSPKLEHEAKVGDILITRAGPSNRVGICALIKETPSNLMISDKLIRFRPILMLGEYIELFIASSVFQKRLNNFKSGMAQSQVNITQSNLTMAEIAIPPYEEQKVIVNKVKKLLSLCEEMESKITLNQTHAELLIQAVLKEAFNHEVQIPKVVNA